MVSRVADDVDRGWAWFVVISACVAQLIVFALMYSLGLIQIILLDTFDEGLVKTSWVLSIAVGLLMLPGPLVGLLTNLTSCRTTMMIGSVLMFGGCTASAFVTSLDHLFITFSLMTGLGCCMVYSSNLVVVGFYFDKHLSKALSVVVTGAGIGILAGPPLVGLWENVFGWRGMFLQLAAFSAHLLVCAMICRPNSVERLHWGHSDTPDSSENLPEKEKHQTMSDPKECRWKKTVKTSLKAIFSVPMLLFCSSLFLWNLAVAVVAMYLPSYVVFHGASKEESTLLFTVLGVCSIVSRLSAGFIVAFVDKFLLFSTSIAIMGILTAGFPFVPASFTFSMVFSGLFGLCTGGPYVVLTSMTKDLVGLAHLATAFGMQMLLSGIGCLVGPPIAALLAESSRTFTSSFLFAGITCICGGASGFALVKCKRVPEIEELEYDPPGEFCHSTVLSASQLSIPGPGVPFRRNDPHQDT